MGQIIIPWEVLTGKSQRYVLLLLALLPFLASGQTLQLSADGVPTIDNQQIEALTGYLPYLGLVGRGGPPVGTYNWLKNEQSGFSSSSYCYPDGPGVYRLRFTPVGGAEKISNCVIINYGTGAGNRNYAVVDQVRTAGIKETQDVNRTANLDKQVTYADGFGRPLQQIAVAATPGTNKDLVQPYRYEAQGEQPKSYLPFALGADGQYKENWQGDQNAFYQWVSPKVGRPGNGPTYSEVVSDDDPLGRVSEKASPGEPWQRSGGHTQKTTQRSNTSNDNVRLWTYTPGQGIGVTGTLAWTSSAAVANTLVAVESRDEDGNWSVGFTNEKGQTVCRRTYLKGAPGELLTSATYLETAYAYDGAGRPLVVLPPKAVQLLLGGAVTPAGTTAVLNQYAFITQYDALGRATARKVPGKARWSYTLYDRWDRVAATQDPNQYGRGVWSFTKYDALNRAIVTGEVSESRSPAALAQALRLWPVDYRAEERADNATGYTLNRTYPTTIIASEVATVDYYDDYDYFPLRSAQRPDLAFVAELGHTAPSAQTRGLRTGGRIRTFDEATYDQWLTSVVYYDQYGRSVQVLQDNFTHNSNQTAREVDRTTWQLAFTGETTTARLTHRRYTAAGTLETHTTELRNTYDGHGRLTDMAEAIDDAPQVTIASLEYNELGQLVDKKLGFDYPNGRYIQSLDYRYNIRGWLTNINNRNLSNNEWLDNSTPNSDTEPQDAFGLELKYEEGSAGRYNGNISAAVWNSTGGRMRQYGYSYDGASRLTDARYSALDYVNGQYVWTAEKDDTEGKGRYTVRDIAYDPNGNITALNRSGLRSHNLATGAPVFGPIDKLSFTHEGNRLSTVADAISQSEAGNDFENGGAGGTYEYDDNGNLTRDPNKKLRIYYNALNLPWLFLFDNGGEINVSYTSTGEKISASYTTATTTKVVQYIQGFTYSTDPTETTTVATPTGRALFEGAATASAPARWGHEYHLRDHQGSLRLVLKQDPVLSYRLTMEPTNAAEEEARFRRVPQTRQLDATHARTGLASARLNAYQADRANGPALTLAVAAGDSVSLEVFGLYDKGPRVAHRQRAVTPVLAIGGSRPAAPAAGPDNPGGASRGWVPSLTAGVAVAWSGLRGALGKSQPPQASFTYELYNQDSVLVASATGLLTETARTEWQGLFHGLRARAAGYVRVYLANASGRDAWFDDLTANRFPVPVRQENHYDPFGQNLEEIELASSFDSPRQYTGQEKSGDSGLNLYDYASRQYDVQLGRFTGIDAAAASYPAQGAYNYCLNNPVNQVDPDGRNPLILNAMARGAMIGGYHSSHSGGSWLGGAINGAAVGLAHSSLSSLGGGSFTSQVMWGAATGAATGLVSKLVYQDSDYTSLWAWAAAGAGMAAYGAWQESAQNNAEEGYYGTNDGTFNHLVGEANVNGEIDAARAQRALDFFSRRNGVVPATYTNRNAKGQVDPTKGPYTTSSGRIYITERAFLEGAATVKVGYVHELGHYLHDVDWAYGIAGGNVRSLNWRQESKLYEGDGANGYNYAISQAGRFHLSYSTLRFHGYGNDAWRAYGLSKWFRLLPR